MNSFHNKDISNLNFLITGGAGFIGSNIVDYLMLHGAGMVRVLDDLSNGSFDNISHHLGKENFEFIEGDIRDFSSCKRAIIGIDYVSHQAALGSVPRSIKNPILTDSVNISGFLNILVASKESSSLKRFVYAASSSTYGDSLDLPKVEGYEGNPLSPYAVTKVVNELYANVFSKVYGFNTIGLRYFNVFGPKQSPSNPYAAVIPLFCKAFIENKKPVIFGDGLTSRDFTYVENAVQANIKAFFLPKLNKAEVFNVACENQTTLSYLVDLLKKISGKDIEPIYNDERNGDIKNSLASIDRAKELLEYNPTIQFEEGLNIVYNWYLQNRQKI